MFEFCDIGVCNVVCGENVVIYQFVNFYDCQFGDNVFVGLFVEIQWNICIGVNSKIQFYIFICEYVIIGQCCFIGYGVMFVNDLFCEGKLNVDCVSWGWIEIGDDVLIGSGVMILVVSICDGVVIGVGSVVMKFIIEKGVWVGNLVRLLWWL